MEIKEVLGLGSRDKITVETKKMGWGKGFRSGRSMTCEPFFMGGRSYARGWGDHAQSEHRIILPGAGKKFEVLVGVEDCVSSRNNPPAHIQFTVWVNGVVAGQSGVLDFGSAPEKLSVDQDVEKLMKKNSVAVKNSAHRYATTFDISYTQFVPIGLTAKTDKNVLKKVLAEVLRDLRDEKLCYVKYEKSQNCFHITVRR